MGSRKHNPFTAPSTSVQQAEYKGTKKTTKLKAKGNCFSILGILNNTNLH